MTTISIDQIEAIAARHHAAEAARNAPKPAAIRAVYELTSLLAALEPDDWRDVHRILIEELAAIDTVRGELLDDRHARD